MATQKPELRKRIDVERSAQPLARFLGAAIELMQVMARACGHDHLSKFNRDDIATWRDEVARRAGISYVGVGRRP